ncbi:hypothetical protein NQ315_015327 [Exocentrus adspersus]|uniref:DNA-directed DNA polymerase n=1 Tax=Exocentrus adspersus TaxID=1586481 RepID=A0AAV8V679_9CUCU|nr:hypothetical protein NQ315_015327 [Exocentrus adspersus]
MEVSADNRYGFILEVDVDYPEELHDKHTDLPFLAENIVPPNSKSKLKKLIPNLYNKSNYIVHYRTLQQAIKNGLILKKIHRVLKFEQSRWPKQYIDLNTQMRNRASNKFEKDFYKLMNNSVFGKTMENVDNRKDIKLCTHWENIELSKTVLYGFYYYVIEKYFEDKASLLYTDTDSLILKIYTDNFYKFIGENMDEFDTSNYKPGNKFNLPINLSVLGKMKDEFPADPIVCFNGTGAKAYYVKSVSDEIKKAKGVKKNVIKKHLTIDDYSTVEKGGVLLRKMSTFTTTLHDMFTEIKNKVALSHKDDKRYIIPNTCKTLAWGHSDIPFYETSPTQNLEYLLRAYDELCGNDV